MTALPLKGHLDECPVAFVRIVVANWNSLTALQLGSQAASQLILRSTSAEFLEPKAMQLQMACSMRTRRSTSGT